MADLTKYAKGKRMVHEDEIKQIKENSNNIEEIEELLEITPTIYYTNDITHLTNNFINALQAGDIVIKQTGSGANNQNHAYRVSFKKRNEGMCLTYTDASCSETVSYDKSAINWHYNSTDVTIFSDFATKNELPAEVEAITPTGTETTLEGLKIGDTSYKVGGGGGEQPHLYCHHLLITISGKKVALYATIYTNNNTQFYGAKLSKYLIDNNINYFQVNGYDYETNNQVYSISKSSTSGYIRILGLEQYSSSASDKLLYDLPVDVSDYGREQIF